MGTSAKWKETLSLTAPSRMGLMGAYFLGNAIPTFSILFDPATPLGMQPAEVTGFRAAGAVVATGMVLSAVPEPHAGAMLVAAVLSLIGVRRRADRS